ncbi:MAG: two-component system response regulator [Pedosphaera sp.]|nr:two-component system response regulator [Pedosphaera sp.]
MKANILIIDDDVEIRELLVQVLQRSGFQVTQAKDAASLKEIMPRTQPDMVLLDYKMPDATGLDLLPIIKKEWPEAEVIMLTGHATYDVAVEATKRGAFHFQEKPFDPESLLNLIKRALEIRSLRDAVSTGNAIFQCDAMKSVVRTVRRVATSDVSILITGESGTGKEVIADLIHTTSGRSGGPLIKINCAALPRELIESELFGSVKGAFTGAHTDREGLFRQAEGGTLLLDELSEMPIDTQSKLLRVLQEKEVRPVGGRTSYKTDCRIIAATNRKPEEAIRDGKLREDLFYRISAVSVHLPPLRERREDILPLANAFLKRYAAQANRDIGGFSPEAAERLRTFDWPGNVRQLQNEVQRAVLLSEGKMVEAADLSITSAPSESTSDTSFTLLEGVERNTIVQMLKETGGNKLETAKRLGIGRQTLYNKIKAYGIET